MAKRLNRIAPLVAIAVVTALASLTCFALPLYVIRPFRPQGATELSVALFVTRIAPWVSAVCATVCLIALLFTWTRTRKWLPRIGVTLCLLLALAGAWLARVNVYERMFHHLDNPQFEAADRAHVEPDDMVVAVHLNGVRRAYPIREMAYHHVVNDTLAGEPIVATY